MRPLLFQFTEIPTGEDVDYSLVEYDEKLNLSVNKLTGMPAIEELKSGTETFTRQTETSDADVSAISNLMDTYTATKVRVEDSDDDVDRIRFLMETETFTRVSDEVSDSDQDTNRLIYV